MHNNKMFFFLSFCYLFRTKCYPNSIKSIFSQQPNVAALGNQYNNIYNNDMCAKKYAESKLTTNWMRYNFFSGLSDHKILKL